MNVFIDTNILFEDYFFKNKSSKQILTYAQSGLIDLYMSEIVRLELRRQYQKELEEQNRILNKVIKDSDHLGLNPAVSLIVIDTQLKIFDDFYRKLEMRHENFHIIPYENSFLPEIVDRAINRKKPFTETKTELKDAVIWLSYAGYVENNKSLKDCVFLTNNTTDFCSKKDKSSVHKDLESDTNRFSIINSSFEFIRLKSPIIESPEHKFGIYIDSLSIDNEYIRSSLVNNFNREIETKLHEEVDGISLYRILPNYEWLDGQAIGFDIDILECEDIEVEVLGKRALISGIIYVSLETEILRYNSCRDPGEDSFVHEAEKYLTFKVYFNFDLLENEICKDFEITDVELDEVN